MNRFTKQEFKRSERTNYIHGKIHKVERESMVCHDKIRKMRDPTKEEVKKDLK